MDTLRLYSVEGPLNPSPTIATDSNINIGPCIRVQVKLKDLVFGYNYFGGSRLRWRCVSDVRGTASLSDEREI